MLRCYDANDGEGVGIRVRSGHRVFLIVRGRLIMGHGVYRLNK